MPSKENLKVVAEFAPPQTYMAFEAFWAWWDIISDSSRGLLILCNLYINICQGKMLAKRLSE